MTTNLRSRFCRAAKLSSEVVSGNILLGQGGTAAQECSWSRVGDAVWSFPHRKVITHRKVRIRFNKFQRPDALSIHRWRRLDEAGVPAGRGKPIHFSLRRDDSSDLVAYRALFRLPERHGHYYIHVFGVWHDVEGSALDQDASWTFHVKVG